MTSRIEHESAFGFQRARAIQSRGHVGQAAWTKIRASFPRRSFLALFAHRKTASHAFDEFCAAEP